MSDTVPLTMLVPDTTVGVVIIWRADSGEIGATWRDTIDRVPMVRTHAASTLRQLADALDAQAREMEPPPY